MRSVLAVQWTQLWNESQLFFLIFLFSFHYYFKQRFYMIFSHCISWGVEFSLLFSTESQHVTFIWYPKDPEACRNYKPNFALGSMSSAHTKVNGRWAQTSKGKSWPIKTEDSFHPPPNAAACRQSPAQPTRCWWLPMLWDSSGLAPPADGLWASVGTVASILNPFLWW